MGTPDFWRRNCAVGHDGRGITDMESQPVLHVWQHIYTLPRRRATEWGGAETKLCLRRQRTLHIFPRMPDVVEYPQK